MGGFDGGHVQLQGPPNVARLLVYAKRQEYRPEDKLRALRSISHLFFITCMHMRQMVGPLLIS